MFSGYSALFQVLRFSLGTPDPLPIKLTDKAEILLKMALSTSILTLTSENPNAELLGVLMKSESTVGIRMGSYKTPISAVLQPCLSNVNIVIKDGIYERK